MHVYTASMEGGGGGWTDDGSGAHEESDMHNVHGIETQWKVKPGNLFDLSINVYFASFDSVTHLPRLDADIGYAVCT